MLNYIIPKKIIYEIYVRSFFDTNSDGIGDIQGIISKLDYLKALSVDYIWLTPIFNSPNKDLGYDVSDYYSINAEFGTMQDLLALISIAHSKGIKVILDLVLNHSSTEHTWFKQALAGDTKYQDYYFFSDHILNNLGSQFGGSAWHQVGNKYFLGLFSEYQADLNWRNPSLREELYNVIEYYLKLGIDGFRFDVISLISKPEVFKDYQVDESGFANFKELANIDPIFDYLHDIKTLLDKYNAISIGEGSGLSIEESIKYKQYLTYVLTFEQMNLDGSEDYKWNDKKVEFKDFINYLEQISNNDGSSPLFLANHDQSRFLSRFGNPANLTLSSLLVSGLTYILTGTPLIYQGDELGMSNFEFKGNELIDIESINIYNSSSNKEEILGYINKKGRDHGRTPMQWDSTKYGGFSKSKPWAVVNTNYKEVNALGNGRDHIYLDFYIKLMKLVKTNPIISQGITKFISKGEVVIYQKILDGNVVTVLANTTNRIIPLDLPKGELLLSNVILHEENKLLEFELRVIYNYKEL
jgi:glycosidase